MNKNLKIALVLILSIFAAHTLHNRREAKSVFTKLKSSELGKDIYTSIELELSTSSSDNIVTTILNMLYGLRDQLSEDYSDNEAVLIEKQDYCAEKINEIDIDVQNIQEKIAKAQQKLPVLEEQTNVKQSSLNEKQTEVDAANSKIAAVHTKNQEAVALFDASVQEHDDMKDALRRAKELITQLVSTGFLQKSKTVLLQLQQHSENTVKNIPNHQHTGIFKMLISMAQDVGIQADQNQVAEIIAIIDELINYETETASVEFQAEQKRLDRFNFDLTRTNAQAEQLDADIKDLAADTKTLQLRTSELQADLKTWQDSLASKKEQQSLQQKACDDSQEAVQTTLTSTSETLDLIQQVIDIFESDDIQDIKQVVGDISYGL